MDNFAQYLVSPGAINLRQSKISVKAVNSLQANEERAFHVNFLVESFCIVFQKYILRQGQRHGLVSNLFSIFHQISGLCSYKKDCIQGLK